MRNVSRSRHVAASAVAAVLALGVSGCGSDTSSTASPSDNTSTPSETLTSASVTPTPTDSTSAGEAVSTSDAKALLADMQQAMLEQKTTHVSMDMGVAIAEGDLAFDATTPRMSLVIDMSASGGQTMRVRYVDGAMYLSMPPLTPAGKFFKVNTDSGQLGSVLGQVPGMTPEAGIEMLSQSLRSMKDLGTEDIEGDKTEHYRVVVDSRKSLSALGGAGLPPGILGSLPKTLQYDIWLTGDQLLRRLGANLGMISLTTDYTRWGDPVTVKAPAPGDLIKAPAGYAG